MAEINIGLDDEQDEGESTDSLIREVIEFCGGPDLIEVFGPSGSGKSEFAVEVAKSAINDADKSVLFIDTERNVGDHSRIKGSEYVYVPDWHDLYAFITRKPNNLSKDAFGEKHYDERTLTDGYDMIVLDSIGFPALIQYGEYRVADDADQFKVFNELQVITGRLKKYAQLNNALVIVTNQPKSALADEDDPDPFGDKSIFGYKEVWKTSKNSSTEVMTKCSINSFRSRQAGSGKELFRLEIDDSGTEIESRYDQDIEDDDFMV